jgi:signal transduction histidine kinase
MPAVVIGHVMDDGRRRDSQDSLTLFPNVRNVAIDYTATSLSIPNRVRFKYRLENFDSNWQDVGTRRTAYYNNLAPGRYVFHVIAANDDGVWNVQGANVALVVPPLFYQTPWFRVLCAALALAAVTALFFGRLRQVTARQHRRLEQRMEDRLNERMRIARELHDTLLQSLQGLLLRYQVVYERLPAHPPEARQDLGDAIGRTVHAITEGRNAVQGLRGSTADGDDLGHSLEVLVEELAGDPARAQGVFRVGVEGTPRPLRRVVRDEIYQIAGEALRNARRHSQASQIEVELRYDDRQLRLRVRDNGSGIDSKFLGVDWESGHYGLLGMRERAQLVGGKLTIWTAADAGTEIELTVPSGRVYAAPYRRRRFAWLARILSRTIKEVAHE